MEFYALILAMQILRAYSVSVFSEPNNDEPLSIAAANIANRCFGSSQSWSELLIIPDHTSRDIIGKIHHKSRISCLIVSPDGDEDGELLHPGECYDYSNDDAEWRMSKTNAVMIIARSPKQLQFILNFLKNNIRGLWRPESYFLVVVEARCDLVEYNGMLKIIWNHWILNAVIMCSSNHSADLNQREIQLYTFNPYSDDHSSQWEIVIHETIEVSMYPGNFNHSWYIFKRKLTDPGSFEDCNDLYFDKTLNLNGYVIPIGVTHTETLWKTSNAVLGQSYAADANVLKLVGNLLRYNVAQVFSNTSVDYGDLHKNGCYTGVLDDLYSGRAHLLSAARGIGVGPGLEMTYPHNKIGACFASRIGGNRPQWKNLADAKQIWIALGLGLFFSTIVFYLQNITHGMVSAFLNAERLIIGSSIIRASKLVKHRIILGSIFLVLLVVDGSIKGRFISILTIARQYRNFDTIEQLKEQDVEMYGHVKFSDVIVDPKLKARLNSSLTIQECLDRLECGNRQVVCFATCQSLQYLTVNFSDIHISSTPIWTIYMGFATAMHWPLTARHSFDIQKLVENGMWKKWRVDIYRKLEINSWRLKRTEQPPYVRPTKLNDLLPAFVLLFIGLLATAFVFAWETSSGEKRRSWRLSFRSRNKSRTQ